MRARPCRSQESESQKALRQHPTTSELGRATAVACEHLEEEDGAAHMRLKVGLAFEARVSIDEPQRRQHDVEVRDDRQHSRDAQNRRQDAREPIFFIVNPNQKFWEDRLKLKHCAELTPRDRR